MIVIDANRENEYRQSSNKDTEQDAKLIQMQLAIDSINNQGLAILMRGQIPVQQPEQVRQAAPEQRQDYRQYKTRKDEAAPTTSEGQREASHQDTRAQQKQQPVHADKKIGRNDPCPCGSGKKYKNCHGRDLV